MSGEEPTRLVLTLLISVMFAVLHSLAKRELREPLNEGNLARLLSETRTLASAFSD